MMASLGDLLWRLAGVTRATQVKDTLSTSRILFSE
jgi:hypothetical protein